MKKEIVRERPFEYLRRRDTNEPFPGDTVRNLYVARAYVLDKLKDTAIAPGSAKHLHAVVGGDSPLMLAVVRQLALSAHYPNFLEYDAYNRLVCKNRTVITLVSGQDAAGILRELEKEENLGNLLQCARYSLFGKVENEKSYVDVTLEVVGEMPEGDDFVLLTEEEALAFAGAQPSEQVFSIDTRKAVYASRVYCLGSVIDNLPYEDINSAGRYNRALDTFQYKVLQGKKDYLQLSTPKWESDPIAVKNGLSNVSCTDCFASRELAVRQQYPAGRKLSDSERRSIWEKNCQALSLSEHGRWVVEKLIMGFSPLSTQERREYGSLFGRKRAAYSKQLKTNAAHPAHIDICSFRDLCRIDPDSLKYDSFLMLAIPLILDAVRKTDH